LLQKVSPTDPEHGLNGTSAGGEIAFRDLSLTIPVHGAPRRVLCDVSAVAPGGRVTAVMGASGSGKTSLLNALCGRAYYGRVTGEVLLDGLPTRIEDHTGAIGFVPQDDILHPDLTVMEIFVYSGLFQLPRGTPLPTVRNLAERLVKDLELEHVKDSLVGNTDVRGISGGQRKRVNIGVELMAQPQLLFLDEPTSGLDATSSFQICGLLANLARRGVTVVTVVHQPRYTVFRLFDRVLLLGFGGHTIFVGSPSGVVDYFTELGYAFPHGENPADVMLDIATGLVSSGGGKGTDTEEDEEEEWARHRRIMSLAAQWSARDPSGIPIHCPPTVPGSPPPLRHVDRPTVWQQYCTFCHRSVAQRSRALRVLILDTLLFAAAAYTVTLATGVYTPAEPIAQQFEFCMLQCLLFSVLTTLVSLRSFSDHKLVFFREAGAGYSIAAFYLSQVTLDLLQLGTQAFIVALIHYEVRGTRCSFLSLVVLYQLVAAFNSGWAYIFALCVPRANVLVFSGIWTACFGTLFGGILSFLTFGDIYDSLALQLLIGALSSVRWFAEWVIVSENRTWPAQYSLASHPFILDYYKLAHNDRPSVLTHNTDDWYYNVAPMLAVGLGLRVVALVLIHTVGRERMYRRPLGALIRQWATGYNDRTLQ